jgi:hypothetical protein
MLPLIAIAGAIGSAFSIAQGVSWAADKLGSTKDASNDGKADAKPANQAKASSFEATLAAQVAGQGVPASSAAPSTPALHGTDYDASARIKAGVIAYNRIGEHHGGHARPHPAAGDDSQVARA